MIGSSTLTEGQVEKGRCTVYSLQVTAMLLIRAQQYPNAKK